MSPENTPLLSKCSCIKRNAKRCGGKYRNVNFHTSLHLFLHLYHPADFLPTDIERLWDKRVLESGADGSLDVEMLQRGLLSHNQDRWDLIFAMDCQESSAGLARCPLWTALSIPVAS